MKKVKNWLIAHLCRKDNNLIALKWGWKLSTDLFLKYTKTKQKTNLVVVLVDFHFHLGNFQLVAVWPLL